MGFALMPLSLAEIVLLFIVVWAFYRLLAPFQRRLERYILRVINPKTKE